MDNIHNISRMHIKLKRWTSHETIRIQWDFHSSELLHGIGLFVLTIRNSVSVPSLRVKMSKSRAPPPPPKMVWCIHWGTGGGGAAIICTTWTQRVAKWWEAKDSSSLIIQGQQALNNGCAGTWSNDGAWQSLDSWGAIAAEAWNLTNMMNANKHGNSYDLNKNHNNVISTYDKCKQWMY